MTTPEPPPQPATTQPAPTQRPAPRRRGFMAGILVGILVFALVAAGALAVVELRHHDTVGGTAPAGPLAATPLPTDLPSTDPALASYYQQRLAWSGCANGDQCASMRVPLDYADPTGKAITLKLLKVPASGKRIGSLVVNPGGPGGSGIQYAQAGPSAWPATVRQHFDLVGFDPRGVGQSTPLQCVDTAGLDKVLAFDPDPDTKAERTELDALVHGVGEGCLSKSGQLARHMSTVEVAKDMDIIRALLGEARLTYFGASYGTFIGATYAGLFPTHVGRMVLDGAIDPALSNAQISLAQGHGFEVALRAYVQDCISRGGCILGDTVDAGTQKIHDFLTGLEDRPLPTNTNRELTAGLGTLGVFFPLYVKQYWPLLTQSLDQAMRTQNGSGLLSLADAYTSRGPNGYQDNSFEALYAVNCLDHDDSIPTSEVPSHYREFEKASPTFGRVFAYSLSTCSTWPVVSGNVTKAIHAKGAPPIVVVGTTRDPATPYVWAKGLARELDSGVLISRDGDGHTGYNRGNACVDDAVNGYLIAGKVPKNGLSC